MESKTHGANGGLSVLKQTFKELAPINQVKNAISLVTDVKQMADLHKRIEAARKYDSKTAERRNYFGELAIWSERHVGVLIREAKQKGVVGNAHKPSHKNSSSDKLSLLLGVENETEARQISSRSQKLAEHEPEEIEAAIAKIKEEGEEVSKAAVRRKLVGAHVGNNSGENEWYTPADYIEPFRAMVGRIDLDPASTEVANEIVRAKRFFDAEADGLSKEWNGAVWMNPPYASGLIDKFVAKLLEEVEAGRTTSACVLVNNATETRWAQSMLTKCSAVCLLASRVKFWHPERESAPLQGQMLAYFGDEAGLFAAKYREMGSLFKRF